MGWEARSTGALESNYQQSCGWEKGVSGDTNCVVGQTKNPQTKNTGGRFQIYSSLSYRVQGQLVQQGKTVSKTNQATSNEVQNPLTPQSSAVAHSGH